MSEDLYLQHYGVLGMHWGVRRYQNKDGTLTARGKKHEERLRAKREKKEQKAHLKEVRAARNRDLQNRREMSDADMDAYIMRLQKEKRFKDLMEADIKPGRTTAKKVLSRSGETVANAAIIGAARYAGEYAIGANYDPLKKKYRDPNTGNPLNKREKFYEMYKQVDRKKMAKYMFEPKKKK